MSGKDTGGEYVSETGQDGWESVGGGRQESLEGRTEQIRRVRSREGTERVFLSRLTRTSG